MFYVINAWCKEMIEFYFLENYQFFHILEKVIGKQKIEEIINSVKFYIKNLDFKNKVLEKKIKRLSNKVNSNFKKKFTLEQNLNHYLKAKSIEKAV